MITLGIRYTPDRPWLYRTTFHGGIGEHRGKRNKNNHAVGVLLIVVMSSR